ncbi:MULTISPECIES: NAD(P)-dependent oxidoreductase [unclassified Mesorhizobium]|uniref:NAD(P)-dependent oxidoreductase n=1 Tax=unclassified Mesorhizobium TaxID=325217 RepID=UPI001671B6D4|nr:MULTISPECIES: NAD(P)-dependent oxidoreductase [unclassified Mesorhizobium]
MQKPVVVLDPHWRQLDELFSATDFSALNQLCELVWARDEPMPRRVLEENLHRASFIISARPKLDAGDIARAENLQAVIEVSGSFPDTIDYSSCFRRGIEVLCCAPGFRTSVAEMAVALALAGARGIVQEHEAFRVGKEHWLDDNAATDFSLYGQAIGFVGFGSIARECCRLLAPFKPKTLAYDPWLSSEIAKQHGAELVALDQVARSSRCLFVTASPTKANKGLIDAATLATMPPGALLVLISRAHVVDFGALEMAVREGRIRAAMDVFSAEPVPSNDSVRTLQNAILSPHRGAAVKGGRHLIGRMIVKDLARMLGGEPPADLQRAQPDLVSYLVGVQPANDDNSVSMALNRGRETIR